ncbi:hypothetical protein ACVWXN_006950 [Bradyrhizobium sp. i1.4.4]
MQSRPSKAGIFRFTILGGIGVTRITVRLSGKVVHDSDCPDPPCHEEMRMPQGVGGAELVVIAKDSTGKVLERKFIVGKTEGQAGGAMSA